MKLRLMESGNEIVVDFAEYDIFTEKDDTYASDEVLEIDD